MTMTRDGAGAVIAQFQHKRSIDRAAETARTWGVDPDLAVAAYCSVRDGAVDALMMSGKMASGKDTVGEATLRRRGRHTDTVRFGVSDELKATATRIAEVARDAKSVHELARFVASLGFEDADALTVAGFIWPEREIPNLSGTSRTEGMRFALQHLGGPATKDQPMRWAVALAPRLLTAIVDGRSCWVGDNRYPAEAGLVAAEGFGFPLVRLHVARYKQLERLQTRDGLLSVDPAVLDHPGETALDDWDGVDARVDNTEKPLETVVDAVSATVDRVLELM